MAFTEIQRVSIRSYLGWSARFHQFDSRLEQALNAIDTEADTQTHIESILADLDDIVTKLKDAYTRLKALQVGSIKLPGKIEIGVLRSEGRRRVGQLAATLGVEVRQDVFSGAAYRSFATAWGLASGTRSNIIPHG